jgi:hypothetical protein
MNTSRKLKIWTLITHGLIIVGWGHGILFFFLIEFFGFTENFPVVGGAILLGQLFILLSFLLKTARFKVITHITGLFFLWLSIVYFVYSSRDDYSFHFATLTAFPFAWCTIITFLGTYLQKFYDWLIKESKP